MMKSVLLTSLRVYTGHKARATLPNLAHLCQSGDPSVLVRNDHTRPGLIARSTAQRWVGELAAPIDSPLAKLRLSSYNSIAE